VAIASWGGYDWDQSLASLMIEKFVNLRPAKKHAQKDESFLRRLLYEAEKAKRCLSEANITDVPIAYDDTFAKVEVCRNEFEEATSFLLEQTMDIVREVVQEVKQSNSSIPLQRAFLVGRSSHMPAVRARLAQVLNEEIGSDVPIELSEPDLSVAMGAALEGFGQRLREIAEADASALGPIFAADPRFKDFFISGSPFRSNEPDYVIIDEMPTYQGDVSGGSVKIK
jgi:molecular chaperone DnaK